MRSPLVYFEIVTFSAKLPVCASEVCDHAAVFVPAEPCCQHVGTAVAPVGVSNDGFWTTTVVPPPPVATVTTWVLGVSALLATSHDAYLIVVVAATLNGAV